MVGKCWLMAHHSTAKTRRCQAALQTFASDQAVYSIETSNTSSHQLGGMTGYQATLEFLQSLEQCGATASENNHNLIANLVRSLGSDGFTIQPAQQIIQDEIVHRNLRGLAEATLGGVNVMDVAFVLICVIFAGLASGLTQGLLSLDLMEMEIKARSGTPEEKKFAAKLIPIISNHHLLLVTLMLWNASATEALPIFLTALVPEYLAIIISVTLVLFVGEIIPASILTGPRQLQISASLTPLVYLVLFIFFPLAYPISYCLDMFIGHDSGMTMYNRKEISTMMRLQREEGVKRAAHSRSTHSRSTHSQHGSSVGGHSHADGEHLFEEEEVTIIDGALKYREMAVSEVMTPAEAVYMISVDEKLSYKLIYEIFKSGYSRIPVYEKDRSDIVGLILAKDLIFIDPEDETPVRNFVDLFGRKPAVVWYDSKLGETLSMFKAEKSHMAIVRDVDCEGEDDPFYEVVGIITLEDIVEEILGTEIEDETDVSKGGDNQHISNTYRDSIMLQPQAPMVRDPELVRLRTMTNAEVVEDSLTDEEVHSIGIYLFTNVPQIQRMFKDNMLNLQKLVRTSAVVSMRRKAAEGAPPAQEDYLYRKGKMTNTCALILSGSVEVTVEEGSSKTTKTRGPWTTLAPEALEATAGTMVTDFSAHITSENLRYLRMSNFQERSQLEDDVRSGGNRNHPLMRMRSFGATFGTASTRKVSADRKTRTLSTPYKPRRGTSQDHTALTALDMYGAKTRESFGMRESQSSVMVEPVSRGGSMSQPLFNIGSYLRGSSMTQALEARGSTSGSVAPMRRDVPGLAMGSSPPQGGIQIPFSASRMSESTGGTGSTRNPMTSENRESDLSVSTASPIMSPDVSPVVSSGKGSGKSSSPIPVPGVAKPSKRSQPSASLLDTTPGSDTSGSSTE